MDYKITKTINLKNGFPEMKRQEILDYFRASWAIEEKLLAGLKPEAFYMRADPLRHPLIFYFGHTASFYINKLIISKVIETRVNPKYESMFAIGVDEMSWDDLNESHFEWPTLENTIAYRAKVKTLVEELIKTLPLAMPINWENPFWIIMMGIEHSRIHLETSSVLIRQLPLEVLNDNVFWDVCHESNKPPMNELLPVNGCEITLGKPLDAEYYGWDNEYGKKTHKVKDFKASKYLVSNAEFKEFIDSDGYNNQKWWTDEGWAWVQYEKCAMPRFWKRNPEGDLKLRLVFKEISMPWDWPVECNYLEAKAFTNWKSEKSGKKLRLPTEEEWYTLYNSIDLVDQPKWETAPGNINLEHYCSPCPVNKFENNGFFDVIGNVWQWTETPIYGFDGFKVHPAYDDFSTPTFDNLHNMIKGGSWISTGNEALKDSRYAFRRHFYQHAGFRYVESEEQPAIHGSVYEDDPEVITGCDFGYGPDYLELGNYSKQLAELIINSIPACNSRKALNLGCRTGRTTFELANCFKYVTGVDFSARMLKIGVNLKKNGIVKYLVKEEGDIYSFAEINLKDLGLNNLRENIDFYQADGSNLMAKFKEYDVIIVENALETMYNPLSFIEEIHNRVNPGGYLVLATTADWDVKVASSHNWPGGFRRDGEPVYYLDNIKELFSKNFDLVEEPANIPYAIRLNSRKFDYRISNVTIWKKK